MFNLVVILPLALSAPVDDPREAHIQPPATIASPLHWVVQKGAAAEKEPQPQEDPRDALRSIESGRGGRHWIDEKTAPPKSPEASRQCFRMSPGMRIELVAAEPLVVDPVAVAFDDLGRMFAAEYSDYPIGPPEGQPPLSRIVELEDIDDDGFADRRHVFADKLNFVHSLLPFDGGILVGAQTEIIFLKDTDGDHRADIRKVLFKGFVPAHPQMQIGNPRWGFDNWIYLNYGPGKISSAAAPDKIVTMPRRDFKFHPRTLEFAADSGLGQFGNTIDNWGHRFFSTNRNPIMVNVLSPAEASRNKYLVVSKASTDVGASGGETRVYPLVAMKSNYLSHAGTHTSACGTTAYRGSLLGKDYQDNVFVCEPVGHLVTRSILKPDGVTLTANRAREKADFLASTDTWFRPASLATGPDGALYVADMYRLWVEHPKFLPPEIAKRIDWRAGEDKGRIWRVLPVGAKRRPYTPPKTNDDLVAMLSDDNGWRRHLAQRLLVERQVTAAAPAVAKVLVDSPNAYGRLHALWILHGLGQLNRSHVLAAMRDADPHVRRDAVRLAEAYLDHAETWQALQQAAGDGDMGVRFQVAMAVGAGENPAAVGLLTQLAARDGHDHWFATGVLTSCETRSADVLAGLVKQWQIDQPQADTSQARGRIHLVRELATVVGARSDQRELSELLTMIAGGEPGAWWQTAALSGLARGLPRRANNRVSLARLIENPPEPLAVSAKRVRELLRTTQAAALDSKRSLSDRLAAIELLSYQSFDSTAKTYQQLLADNQTAEVQAAAIEAMRSAPGDQAARMILQRWRSLGPSVRSPALTLLLRSGSTTKAALEGMAAGTIQSSVLDIDQRVRLLKSGDAQIRGLAEKLFGGAVSADRRAVAKKYETALTMEASSERGMKVFDRVCSKCHKLNGRGHQVGPDISDVRNRSREALLYDVLDPNRKVEPRFSDYTVVTDGGRVFNGLIISDGGGAVVLLQGEGKQQIIPRNEIDEISATGKSLMPEGVEKEVNVQQMADLLEFLKPRAANTGG